MSELEGVRSMLKSSRKVRRFLNRLIRFANRFVPVTERIEFVPVIPFREEVELEIVVLKYWQAIYDGYAEWHDGQGENDPSYQNSQTRISAIEAKYSKRLDEYLKPYEGIHSAAVSQHEQHRARVAQQRIFDRRRK